MLINWLLTKEWRPITMTNGAYEISNEGEVRRVGQTKNLNITARRRLHGHLGVYLIVNGKGSIYKVANILAKEFLGLDGLIRLIDKNPYNISLGNISVYEKMQGNKGIDLFNRHIVKYNEDRKEGAKNIELMLSKQDEPESWHKVRGDYVVDYYISTRGFVKNSKGEYITIHQNKKGFYVNLRTEKSYSRRYITFALYESMSHDSKRLSNGR